MCTTVLRVDLPHLGYVLFFSHSEHGKGGTEFFLTDVQHAVTRVREHGTAVFRFMWREGVRKGAVRDWDSNSAAKDREGGVARVACACLGKESKHMYGKPGNL